MTDHIPIYVTYDLDGNPTGVAEFQAGATIPAEFLPAGAGGGGNIDGGTASSVYGGTTGIDGGGA
jgi:hypothetical protein